MLSHTYTHTLLCHPTYTVTHIHIITHSYSHTLLCCLICMCAHKSMLSHNMHLHTTTLIPPCCPTYIHSHHSITSPHIYSHYHTLQDYSMCIYSHTLAHIPCTHTLSTDYHLHTLLTTHTQILMSHIFQLSDVCILTHIFTPFYPHSHTSILSHIYTPPQPHPPNTATLIATHFHAVPCTPPPTCSPSLVCVHAAIVVLAHLHAISWTHAHAHCHTHTLFHIPTYPTHSHILTLMTFVITLTFAMSPLCFVRTPPFIIYQSWSPRWLREHKALHNIVVVGPLEVTRTVPSLYRQGDWGPARERYLAGVRKLYVCQSKRSPGL